MIHSSEKLSPTRAMPEHCGTGACMNILNYFWGTTFGLKDTLDIETMIRFGHFDWNERPSEQEVVYFLAQMGFKTEIYSRDVGDWTLYLSDPEWHQKKHGYTPHPLVNTEISLRVSKMLSGHSNYTLIEDAALDIASVIRSKSDGRHMFLFWLDRFAIENYKTVDGTTDGHIMASLGYVSPESDKIWLVETYPVAEVIERTYGEILEAQKFLSPEYDGPKWEVIVISLSAP